MCDGYNPYAFMRANVITASVMVVVVVVFNHLNKDIGLVISNSICCHPVLWLLVKTVLELVRLLLSTRSLLL